MLMHLFTWESSMTNTDSSKFDRSGPGKRSGKVGLTRMARQFGGVVGGAALLASCGSDGGSAPVAPEEKGPKLEVSAYENVFECAANSGMSQDECTKLREQSIAAASETAPRFADSFDCEAQWGQGNCVPQTSGGQSFFMPFVSGFLLGKLLNNKREVFPLFRKDRAGPLQTANGVRLGYNGAPGKYTAAARAFEKPQAVPKVASASAAASRAGLTQSREGSSRVGGFVVVRTGG